MDGSPQLLTNIQFAEAKKGYDRDQVDNFLRELSGKVGELQDMLRLATQRAEAAEVALAEAEKAKQAAESAAAKARADAESVQAAGATVAASEVEAATGVLAMAQKTAEATIGEAEGKAADIIADARDRAATIVVEVEREAERRKEEAHAHADQLVAERVTVIEQDVERLSAQRDGLQLDVDLLRHYLDEHRTKIRRALDDISTILDQPGALTPDKAPEMGGTSADTLIDSVTRPTVTSAADPEPASSPAATTGAPSPTGAPAPTGATSPTGAPSATGAPTSVTVGEPTPPSGTPVTSPAEAPAAPSASSSPGGASGVATAEPVTAEPVTAEPVTAAPPTAAEPELTIVTVEDLTASADPEADFPAVKAPELFDAPDAGPATGSTAPVDPGSGSLFSQSTDEPTQAYDVLAGGEPPEAEAAPDSSLGHVEDDADEAMRAFFEQDLDAAAKDDKPRGFLRRK